MRTNEFDYSILKDAFALYLEEYEKELPTDEEVADVTFTPEFEAKMERLLRRQSKPYYVLVNTAGKRVASVILAVLLGLMVTTFSVKALREPFIRFITEMFEKFTSIVFVQNEEPDDEPFVFEKMEPQYVPEGYVVDSVVETEAVYNVKYTHSTMTLIDYKQRRSVNVEMNIDTESTAYQPITIAGLEGVKYKNKDTITLTFCNKHYMFALVAPITLDENELLRMAESIVQPIES